MFHPDVLVSVILAIVYTANGQIQRRCTLDSDCLCDEICDMPPTSHEQICLPLKPLNEPCDTERQCSEKVSHSECKRQEMFYLSYCVCRLLYKELDGQCRDIQYCRYDSDCDDFGYGYTCIHSACTYRGSYSDPTYVILCGAFMLLVLVVILTCCVRLNRSATIADNMAAQGRLRPRLAPSSSVPEGGAAPYISSVARLTSLDSTTRAPFRDGSHWTVPERPPTDPSLPLCDELPPPSYLSVVNSQAAYSEASRTNGDSQS